MSWWRRLEVDDDDALMQGLADLLVRNAEGDLHRRVPEDIGTPDRPTRRSGPQPEAHGPAEPEAAGPAEAEGRSAEGGEPVVPHKGLVIDGKRELLRYIGAGSFGSVYEARQRDLYRLEAIKFLHERWMAPEYEEVRARFLAEARVMARLRGPHLVAVYDWGTLPGGLPFFVMERLHGQTLRARLRDGPPLPLAELFEIGAQILEGLCEAHAHDVVHRDVKPENIFLTEEGVKLLDFGLAKTSVAMTSTDAVMGTPLYMAPELISGAGKPDARTDLYAASAVLYEMLVGQAPFRRPELTRSQLERAILHESPVPPGARRDGVPPALDEVICRGLAKDQARRPSSARVMLERLLDVREAWEAGAEEPTAPAEGRAVRGTSAVEAVEAVEGEREPERSAEVHAAGDDEAGSREVAPRRRRWLVVAVLLSAALVATGLLAWPPTPDLGGASGGVLVVRSQWASEDTKRRHAAVCSALGGDQPLPRDAVGVLPVRCVTLSRWDRATDRMARLAEDSGAKAVVDVDGERAVVTLLERARKVPLLSPIEELELSTSLEDLERVSPVLAALLDPQWYSDDPLPVLVPERDGFHWALLSEVLRRSHGRRDPEARRRLEQLSRCRMGGGHEVTPALCGLARLLLAVELPCDHAIEPLRDLLAGASRDDVLAVNVRVELARCLVEGRGPQDLREAAGLVEAVIGGAPDDPCVRASVMSTAARLSLLGVPEGDVLLEQTRLDRSTLHACAAGGVVVTELAARADAFASASPPRWCAAERDGADAHELNPFRADVLVNWAEASAQCSDSPLAARRAVLDELIPWRFDPGSDRTSVAFMRWVMTREAVDAQEVRAAYRGVPDGRVPLLPGTASSLDLCADTDGPCAYEILTRPKSPQGEPQLARALGLDDSGGAR